MKNLSILVKTLRQRIFSKRKATAIVYYIYINPEKDWQQLILGQIEDIQSTGVLTVADLYIIVSNPTEVKGVIPFFEKLSPLYKNIQFYTENKFEYWGLLCVWQLAQTARHYKYIAYFHTKGMTHPESGRAKVEEILTHFTFKDWSLILKTFQINRKVNKVGLFPAFKVNQKSGLVRGGWIWYNFWWARAEYIRALEEPKINPKHRYYYEEWISYLEVDDKSKFYDSFSLYSLGMETYTTKEVLESTDKLVASFKKNS